VSSTKLSTAETKEIPMAANSINAPRHKEPGTLNDGLEVPNRERPVTKAPPAAAQPVASRAPTPVTAQHPGDGVDPAVPANPPSGVTNEQIRDKGNDQAQEMRDWQWLMMDLQHQQAKNSLIATAASAISSDAARTAKDIAGRIG
jgi:hypothetical protein